jgi:hypothetical protein
MEPFLSRVRLQSDRETTQSLQYSKRGRTSVHRFAAGCSRANLAIALIAGRVHAPDRII